MGNRIALDFQSKTGEGLLAGRLYLPSPGGPETPPLEEGLLIQIVHGLAEHMDRYDTFCRHLASLGMAACVFDLPGHGQSAVRSGKSGHFGPEGSGRLILDDLDEFAALSLEKLKRLTPVQSWKRVLFGHSMGSFIMRAYLSGHPAEPAAGAIYSGTIGRSLSYYLGRWLASRSARKNGPLHPDVFLQKLCYANYLRHIKDPRTPFDWLTRDTDTVDRYMADPLCGFPLTASGYREFFGWLIDISRREWASKIPQDLPCLVISGSDCPVGNFGRGPREVCARLRQTSHNVELKIFQDDRHEILNEINREEVWQFIVDWLKRKNLYNAGTPARQEALVDVHEDI